MEVTVGPPSVIRSGTGLAGPSRAGAMVVPGAATALEDCLQAVGGVPWLSPGTRHPWSGSPVGRISCGACLRGEAGRCSSPWDDAGAHEPLATGGTPPLRPQNAIYTLASIKAGLREHGLGT